MNSVLNLSTTWTTRNFLNYVNHSFSGIIAYQHDPLNKNGKNVLRMMETPAAIFKNLCKQIETEFIKAELASKEKTRE